MELAVIMPILIMLLAFPVFFGRLYMHYTVIQKAAHSAAVYYAGVAASDLNTQARAFEVEKVAIGLINDQIAQLRPGNNTVPFYQLRCDDGPCGWATPTNITVHIRLTMYDDIFNNFTWLIGISDGIDLESEVTIPYVGS